MWAIVNRCIKYFTNNENSPRKEIPNATSHTNTKDFLQSDNTGQKERTEPNIRTRRFARYENAKSFPSDTESRFKGTPSYRVL